MRDVWHRYCDVGCEKCDWIERFYISTTERTQASADIALADALTAAGWFTFEGHDYCPECRGFGLLRARWGQ